MSDLPIVAWLVENGRVYRAKATTHEETADHDLSWRRDGSVKTALVRLSDATASLASAQQRIEELERALERVTCNFRLVLSSKPCRDVSETLAEADAALARAIGTREGGDANAAPGRSPESAVATATRPSEAFLSGISPQSAWPFAQDDKGTK